MKIVAVHAIPEDMNGAVIMLARVTGMGKYDAASRLRQAGKVPVIIGGYAVPVEAEDVSSKLTAAGFGTIIIERGEGSPPEDHFKVRTFSFEDTLLRVGSRQGDEIIVDYGAVSLILCGKGIITETETIIEKSKKLSLGRAVVTSGLMITKKEEKHYERVTENREGFIQLVVHRKPVLVFKENDLDYASLGTAMKPSRYANLTFIAEELRKRCSNAVYDDSLLNKNVQMQILGPLFDPEKHLDIATALVRKALSKKS